MKKVNFIKLVVSIIICEAAGAVGAIFTTPASSRGKATASAPTKKC